MWSRARHEEKKADILKYDTSCFSTIESHHYIRVIFSTSLFVHAMPIDFFAFDRPVRATVECRVQCLQFVM